MRRGFHTKDGSEARPFVGSVTRSGAAALAHRHHSDGHADAPARCDQGDRAGRRARVTKRHQPEPRPRFAGARSLAPAQRRQQRDEG